MYRVINQDLSNRATCSVCCQWVDCAQCSNPKCGDLKCVACYNKAVAPKQSPSKQKPSAPLIKEEDDF